MENAEYQNIFDNEVTNFYYLATHELVMTLVKRYIASGITLRLLDAGAGTGMLAKKLASLGNVQAVDISPHAVSLARRRGIRVRKASLSSLPYASGTFDAVTCIDVLYHRRVNERQALRELYRVLKPGGVVIFRVPALSWLRTCHDDFVHTRHRYTKGAFARKLRAAGFLIELLSYVDFSLLPFRIVMKLYESLVPVRAHSSIMRLPTMMNLVMTTLMRLDHLISLRIPMPIGLGLVAVARKGRV